MQWRRKEEGPNRVMGCRCQSRIYNFCLPLSFSLSLSLSLSLPFLPSPHLPTTLRILFFLSCRLPGRNNCFPPDRKEQNCLGWCTGKQGESCKMSYSDSSKIRWYPMLLFNTTTKTVFLPFFFFFPLFSRLRNNVARIISIICDATMIENIIVF